MRVVLACVAFLASLPFASLANVIVVDASGGGDYTQIQPAIDAAVEGDIILVAAGSYPAFTLAKGVMIRAIDASRFVIADPGATIVVENVAAGAKAGISGLHVRSGWTAATKLEVRNCPGEVVLEQVTMEIPLEPDRMYLSISGCANVALSTFRQVLDYPQYGSDPAAVISIAGSSVRATDVFLRGADAGASVLYSVPGGIGIKTQSSFLVLARPDILGGRGAHSSSGCMSFAGAGGHGVDATATTLVVLGTGSERIRGGEGGATDCWPDPGGDGGDGLHLDGASGATVSRVILEGGAAGAGTYGDAGKPYTGFVTFDHRMAALSMSPDPRPGHVLTLTINAVEPGQVVLLVAGHGGFQAMPGAVGPPLSVLPGQWFFAIGVGSISPPADKVLPLLIPDDDVVRGIPVNTQAVVLGTAGGLFLTNAAIRVISG